MIKVSKHPNTPAMRVQYFLSLFLSVLIIISACQGGVHRMYMDSNGSPATRQAKEESRASLIPSQALISGLSDTNSQNGKGSLLPSTSSNGALASTAQSVHVLQPHSDKNASGEVAKSQDAKREEVSQASSGLTDWFHRFVDAVDHAEEWAEVAGVLAEGRRRGYLDKGVAWDDDQYTPLHYAAEEGNLRVVEELVKRDNISVDGITGRRKRTPLQFAASAGHLQVVRFLVQEGARISYIDEQRSNALHYAAAGCDDSSIAIIEFFD